MESSQRSLALTLVILSVVGHRWKERSKHDNDMKGQRRLIAYAREKVEHDSKGIVEILKFQKDLTMQ